ncbi:hypothetical protein [Synechocystis sp. PCC 6714]|jgi:hypothetical protein|uniref:hypothetical protein n=1 Tax=Synechocystis sp. (strain PCC 6714) TaxID=1147 RepID=UPI00040455F2|nr:hypothetical protein [Synechocystis sp. PCC 6714]AIE76306.1 hypothetical protein D082_60270 [Synechocystis sp. PCC 6714]
MNCEQPELNDKLNAKKDLSKSDLVLIMGGCNSVEAKTFIQINGDTLTAFATALQNLPSDSVVKILDPLGEVLKAAGIAITKAQV